MNRDRFSLPTAVSGTVYGVILNDKRSLARLGDALQHPPYKTLPRAPVVYIKPANTLLGSGGTIELPVGETSVEIGATLGIVIGAPASRLSLETALAVVAGIVVVADLSLPHASYYRPAIREKCFDNACPMSAEMAPAEHLRDIASLDINTWVNGVQVDSWSPGDLVRGVAELLRDITEFMSLRSGDMLLLGVPWQAPEAKLGDQVKVMVQGVGEVTFRLAATREQP